MKIAHGGIAIDVPDSWEDRSTLLFVAPRPQDQLPVTANVERPTEAVAVSFRINAGVDAKGVLEEQAAELRAINPELEILGMEPFASGLGEGWCSTQRLTVFETTVRQLCFACVLERVTVLATASAAESRFARCEEMLSSVLRSLGPAK